MTLIAFGINHKTAPVEVREKVALSEDLLADAQASLNGQADILESVIVSTCNRTEIYARLENETDEFVLRDWLADFHHIEHGDLDSYSYRYTHQQAVQHIMRVASGLDSLILGEPQILGQIKQAFTSAKHAGTVNSHFERLFQQTFSIAKKVRTETEIGANAVSVAYAAVQLAKHIFSELKDTRVLLIGAGETSELVARHLYEQGVRKITVANRTLARAEVMAEPIGAEVITLAQIPHHLSDADIVISSTASQLPILGKGVVETALKNRRHQPMFLVDLAVPRDIENEVSELADAYLYTVDDLQHIVEENLATRQNAAQEADQMIQLQAQHFMQWDQSQQSINLLRQYRQQSEVTRNKIQERALNQLAEGQSPEKIIVELANKLTNNLIHSPTRALKQAAETQDEAAMRYLQQVLGLESDSQ